MLTVYLSFLLAIYSHVFSPLSASILVCPTYILNQNGASICSYGLFSLSLPITISQECTVCLTLVWYLCSPACCSLSLFYQSGVTLMFHIELEPDPSYSAHLYMTFNTTGKGSRIRIMLATIGNRDSAECLRLKYLKLQQAQFLSYPKLRITPKNWNKYKL